MLDQLLAIFARDDLHLKKQAGVFLVRLGAQQARLLRVGCLDEFEDRDTVLLGGSTDTAYSHLGWVKSHADLGDLKYPLFADVSKQMAADYGILHPQDAVALRGTFIIDPEGDLRWVNVNDLNVGRSVQETLRVLDALQTDELCACGREVGGATLEL